VSEANPPPEEHEAHETPAPRSSRPLAAALPYIATAVAAVLCSLIIQLALRPPAAPTAPQPPTATAYTPTAAAAALTSPTSVSRETPAPATPTTSALPADEGGLRLAILDLEAADRRLWSAIYLLRAASQIDDAVVALQSNDLDEVDRVLLNARRSFDRAYAFSAEQEKGPIDAFRLQIGQARDDLHLRPEGLDRRLRQIRQLVLSLVDESGT
jgi:hypothetical protein